MVDFFGIGWNSHSVKKKLESVSPISSMDELAGPKEAKLS